MSQKAVNVAVFCAGKDGVPTGIVYRVRGSLECYENGAFYESAKDKAAEDGYENPMVSVDENDDFPLVEFLVNDGRYIREVRCVG